MSIDVLDVLSRAIRNVDREMSPQHAEWRAELEAARTAVGNLLRASDSLAYAIICNGDWDDGCFYYNGTSSPELQQPMRDVEAAIEAASEGKPHA